MKAKLDYAHQFGIKSLKVVITQYPTEQNGQIFICQAELFTADDRVFSDRGDASPLNVPRGCADSFHRIASTRAKSRVLSDAFNIKGAVIDDADMSPEGEGGEYITDAEFSPIEPMQRPALPSSFDGGGAKPASDKQLHLISSLASQGQVSSEDMAASMFGKTLDQLQGSEANQLIKQLK
ncbi:hypothetical protein [Solidesulfovibrio carbinolicus]|uniref:hypothetical protein n=1 Tax=Solidesulfovibrio carbinolicus TaxID=296842 RepID=UPI001011DF36|nr:hypothetical protein [Solidesulfovibrio carbinolicus]